MIKKVILVFKTHLDVGFTHSAAEVKELYFEQYIPNAIALARKLRDTSDRVRLVWTTGSWLMLEYLEQQRGRRRKELEEAIQRGDLAWHAMPFTCHTELLDTDLLRYGLSLSHRLDERFGVKTIAAKMTDVPGHTQGLVSVLMDEGVRFLHLGVNPASTAPAVPPCFYWQCGRDRLLTAYSHGNYGSILEDKTSGVALCLAHSNDNLGPPSEQEVSAWFTRMRKAYPGAEVVAGRLDDFARPVLRKKTSWPVVRAEIGDTWIHGAASDPLKLARFRALCRLRRKWVRSGTIPVGAHAWDRFSRNLLLVAEHTWGRDQKTWLPDESFYSPAQLAKVRQREDVLRMEASWQEQRAYIDDAVAALGHGRAAAEAQQVLSPPSARPLEKGRAWPANKTIETRHFQLRFSAGDGSLIELIDRASGHKLASDTHPLGCFHYQAFGREEYDRFARQYLHHLNRNGWWAIPDFTKPGMPASSTHGASWHPCLKSSRLAKTSEGTQLQLVLHMPAPAVRHGAPRTLMYDLMFPDAQPSVRWTLHWRNKPASRLPEASWFTFRPCLPAGTTWSLHKLGREIDPNAVCRCGNRKLHALQEGLTWRHDGLNLHLSSLDAALVAPGAPSLLDFNQRQPSIRGGVHMNLHNNVWGTNFPLWFGEDAFFRFELSL